MRQARCFFTIFLLLLTITLFAGGGKTVIEQQPAWATTTTINYTATAFDDDAEDGYSDLHYEKQVSLAQQAVFIKKVVHILSEAGVQNHSEIAIDYDPAYESLAFHTIRIIRGTERINKLHLSGIRTLEQEKERDRFLYNGSLTAVLVLDDVRKNDIIEYSYTIKGFNPIYKSKYATFFETAFSFPFYSLYYRVVVPKGKTIFIKNSLTDIKPVVAADEKETSYAWTVTNAAAIHPAGNTPSWFDAYPSIMVSESSTWKEVADWAAALFPFDEPLSGDVQKKIAEIKESHPTPEAQLLAALRFVQDDVRYLGFEMGENSHKPHAPSQVFRQRFGDCKDKAYLLCTLLKALAIEAYPVLNNTYFKSAISGWQPSPIVFDHATVCVQLKGKTWWFDPTISSQRGPLEAISYPDYQVGLVIRPGTTDLTTIPVQHVGKVDTKETFRVEELKGKVGLKVVTHFSGSFADDTRYSFMNNSQAEIKRKYREFYGKYFSKIEIDSLSYSDDEASGVFTTTEHYTIKSFWNEEEGKTRALLRPYFINTILKVPGDEDRQAPFSLPYPARYHEEVEVILPQEWPIEEAYLAFKHTAFRFNYRYSNPRKNVVLLTYNYENLSDHIRPEDMASFVRKMNEAEETSAFEIYTSNNKRVSTAVASSTNQGFAVAYVLLGLCVLGTYAYRNRSKRRHL